MDISWNSTFILKGWLHELIGFPRSLQKLSTFLTRHCHHHFLSDLKCARRQSGKQPLDRNCKTWVKLACCVRAVTRSSMSLQDQLITVYDSLFPELNSCHILGRSFKQRMVFKDHRTFHSAAHVHWRTSCKLFRRVGCVRWRELGPNVSRIHMKGILWK